MTQTDRFAPERKLTLHPQFSAYLAGQKVYPVNVEISPCGVCQASCDFCFYANTGELGEHRNVMLDRVALNGLLGECMWLGVKSVSWTGGGEPTLHPNFAEFVECAKVCGLKQGLFTNALATPKYDPSKLEWVRVTMTDKPFNYHALTMLRACKTFGFAFNWAGKQDGEYLRETLNVAERVGADYVQVRPALKFHGQTVDIEPPQIEHPLLHVTGYKFQEAKKPHDYKECEGYHFVPFIWEDGNVDVCAYMRKHQGYTLGNIYKDSLKDILDRAPQSVPVHRNCQVCCRNHEINKLVHSSRALLNKEFP